MAGSGPVPEVGRGSRPSWHGSRAAGPGCEELPLCPDPAVQGHKTQTVGARAGTQCSPLSAVQPTHLPLTHGLFGRDPVKGSAPGTILLTGFTDGFFLWSDRSHGH